MEGRLRTLLGFSRLKDFRPVLPRGAVVMDERIRTNAEMRQVDSYQTTAWLPKKAAEQKRATAGRVPPPVPWWRAPWVVGVASLALLAPLLLVWHRSRRLKSEPESKEGL